MTLITEKERRDFAWGMIDDISAHAESLDPKRDWKESQDAVCRIYEITHSILAPKCRKNHPGWVKQIDEAILADRRSKSSGGKK